MNQRVYKILSEYVLPIFGMHPEAKIREELGEIPATARRTSFPFGVERLTGEANFYVLSSRDRKYIRQPDTTRFLMDALEQGELAKMKSPYR